MLYPTWLTLCSLFFAILLQPVSAEVTITGLDSETAKNAQLMLSLSKENCTTPVWKIRGYFNKTDSEIDQALRALGYYHAEINKTLDFTADCWHASVSVHAGPRVVLTGMDIVLSGETEADKEFSQLRRELLQAIGQPLRHDKYEKMKNRLLALVNERGYLQAEFVRKELLIDKENNQAQINWEFNSGKRMRFGDVQIHQSALRPELVEKLVSIKSNAFYSSDVLAKTHNALSKSGYFDLVDIRPDSVNTQANNIPITINLASRKVHHYGFGVGYDTDIGPLLNATFINRRLNDRGHYLTANLDLSPVLSTADFEYSIPLEHPLNDIFSFGGGLKREHTDTYSSLATKVSARLKNAFDNGWRQTLYLDSVYEDFTAGATSNKVLLLVPGGSWLTSVADNTLRPTQGHRLEINLLGSYKNPISDVSFAQASIASVWMQALPWKARLLARTEQGATLVDEFARLPTSYRFYAGGMNSIRGYAYKELGPKDTLGTVSGGKFLSVFSVEYEQSVLGDWAVAAFVDSGNAYNLNAMQLKTGTGVGLRWYSPIGLIRFDFAVPLSDANAGYQIHFAAGTRL